MPSSDAGAGFERAREPRGPRDAYQRRRGQHRRDTDEKRNLVAAARTALRMPRFNLIKQMSDSKSVIGLNMLTLWDARGTLEPWIAPLRELLEDGTIQPVVAEAFRFDRAGDAHRMISERRNVGKVVLVP
jgi:NADPH:quinone reductase-like Zn-dependent oxidoreductase